MSQSSVAVFAFSDTSGFRQRDTSEARSESSWELVQAIKPLRLCMPLARRADQAVRQCSAAATCLGVGIGDTAKLGLK